MLWGLERLSAKADGPWDLRVGSGLVLPGISPALTAPAGCSVTALFTGTLGTVLPVPAPGKSCRGWDEDFRKMLSLGAVVVA